MTEASRFGGNSTSFNNIKPGAFVTRLYLISPERLDHPDIFADELRHALDGGDVAAFQLRLKGVGDGEIARATDTLRPICQQRDVAFIMNDRPDLAVRLDCDGVHVGQEDMSYAEARRIDGDDAGLARECRLVERAVRDSLRGDRRNHRRELPAGDRGRRRLFGRLGWRVELQGRTGSRRPRLQRTLRLSGPVATARPRCAGRR